MVNRIRPNEEKTRPVGDFVIHFPMNFSISSTASLYSKFKETFKGEYDNPNRYLKRKFLEIFEVNNIQELFKKYPDVRYAFNKFKDELKREAGIEINFSKWVEEEIKKRIEEYEKK